MPTVFWAKQDTNGPLSTLQHVARSFFGISPTTVANESDFSRLKQLLTDQRKGRMSEETVARKMGLMLNTDFWRPNPELNENDEHWGKIVTRLKLGLLERGPGGTAEAAVGDEGDDEEDGAAEEEWWWW